MTQNLPLDDLDDRHPLAYPNFRLFWLARLLVVLAGTAQAAAVAWHIYEIARRTSDIKQSAFLVGMFGLAQFVAMFAMTIPAGIIVDRVNRKWVVLATIGLNAVLSLIFWFYAKQPSPAIWVLFALGLMLGALRAFQGPAMTAVGPMLVPRHVLSRAIAISSVSFQVGAIVGPALGGFMIAFSAPATYLVTACAFGLALILVLLVNADMRPEPPKGSKMEMLKEGIAFVWANKPILGSMSLDLVAVLLAGATALLPVFAKDILHVSGFEFGLLRASFPVGALLVSLYLSQYPLQKHAGKWMYACVATFGVATIIFGLSQNYYLSVVAMLIMGATDMISVYVRGSLIQLMTPDAMRGRVASVSILFIGASNELGEFESGVTAKLMGPVGAALFGGIGSIIATGVWIKLFPELYRIDSMDREAK